MGEDRVMQDLKVLHGKRMESAFELTREVKLDFPRRADGIELTSTVGDYTVLVTATEHHCSCPDSQIRHVDCKHILATVLKAYYAGAIALWEVTVLLPLPAREEDMPKGGFD